MNYENYVIQCFLNQAPLEFLVRGKTYIDKMHVLAQTFLKLPIEIRDFCGFFNTDYYLICANPLLILTLTETT